MELPLIVEPERLAESLGAENLLVVDLCKAETSASTQVPGPVRLEYASVIASRNPAGGFLPEASQLGSVLSALGSPLSTTWSPTTTRAAAKPAACSGPWTCWAMARRRC